MTDKLREAAQQNEREAFEAWARPVGFYLTRNEILGHYTNIDTIRAWEGWQARAALAQQDAHAGWQQEPVAWRTFDGEGGYEYRSYDDNEGYAGEWAKRNPNHVGWVKPLYTAPQPAVPTPPAQRVMLTPDEIDEVWNSIAGHSIYAEYQIEIASAMIEAYERKNGIK